MIPTVPTYCASSAPTPLIPPRLTETKAQHESSMTEQALEAELLLAPTTSSTFCMLCKTSGSSLGGFWLQVGVKSCSKRMLIEPFAGSGAAPGSLLGVSGQALGGF